MKPSLCSHDPASWQEMAFQEVLTLHVRAFAGEQRAQALGEVVKTRVCPACLQACVENSLDEKRSLRQLILRYGLIGLAGLLLLVLSRLPAVGQPALLPGVLALGFGGLGFVRARKEEKARLERLRAMDPEARQRELLPAFILRQLPDKSGENNLSYIPLTEELKNLEIPELMARYGLMKEIARQLKGRLEEISG